MIVKSMSRKAPTFSQLAGYIGQDGSGGSQRCFARNLYYTGDNQKVISGLFLDNYKYLPPRKNGNALYHEIIVLEPQPHLPKDRQMQILQALAHEYCEKRAPHQLTWGRVHFDTTNPHIHLMISANDFGSKTRKRLDRKSYAHIQRELESYKEVHFPELVEHRVYNKASSDRVKTKSNEGEMVRRTGRPSQKQSVRITLKTLFEHHTHVDALKTDLNRAGFCLYQRGKQWGVENIETRKRYRLKTLGLDEAFTLIVERSQAQRGQPETNSKDKQIASPASRPKPNLTPKENPETHTLADSRAQALLKAREQLERSATKELSDFNRGLDEGRDR